MSERRYVLRHALALSSGKNLIANDVNEARPP